MSQPDTSYPAPRVGVYALIGQDDRLLVIKHAEHHALPGGTVHAGEAVEQALRRTVRDQLEATISHSTFCAVIEHGTTQPGHHPASEVSFLFDVTLTNPGSLDESSPHLWAGESELSCLRPEAIRDALIAGTLSADNPWRAWTP